MRSIVALILGLCACSSSGSDEGETAGTAGAAGRGAGGELAAASGRAGVGGAIVAGSAGVGSSPPGGGAGSSGAGGKGAPGGLAGASGGAGGPGPAPPVCAAPPIPNAAPDGAGCLFFAVADGRCGKACAGASAEHLCAPGNAPLPQAGACFQGPPDAAGKPAVCCEKPSCTRSGSACGMAGWTWICPKDQAPPTPAAGCVATDAPGAWCCDA